MNQKRRYKQYLKEFKDEAVALVLEEGYFVSEAAKSLGITAGMRTRGRIVTNKKSKARPWSKMRAMS